MRKLLNYPLKLLEGLLDRALALTGALLLAQFPQFFSQYLQRLGGHLDEARRALQQYESTAAAVNLTLEEYIQEHLQSGNEVFTGTGEIISGVVQRFHELEQSYRALSEAPALSRWWVFLQEADWSIAARAWSDFTPGIPTTMEGLIYAAAGLLLGWALFALLKTAAGWLRNKWKTSLPKRI